MEKYETLKNHYPELLSLDHVYKICRISKKSARYLVQHGIIPAIDTGRQTWRYQIKLDDVIDYLKRRGKWGSMIPPGAVTSRDKTRKSTTIHNRKSFAQLVTQGQEHEIAEYFNFIYGDYDDILTITDLTEMTGLNKNTIQKLCRNGHIKALEIRPKYLVPKQYLLEFVVTRRFIEAKTDSETFKKILGGFEIWKAKSSR